VRELYLLNLKCNICIRVGIQSPSTTLVNLTYHKYNLIIQVNQGYKFVFTLLAIINFYFYFSTRLCLTCGGLG